MLKVEKRKSAVDPNILRTIQGEIPENILSKLWFSIVDGWREYKVLAGFVIESKVLLVTRPLYKDKPFTYYVIDLDEYLPLAPVDRFSATKKSIVEKGVLGRNLSKALAELGKLVEKHGGSRKIIEHYLEPLNHKPLLFFDEIFELDHHEPPYSLREAVEKFFERVKRGGQRVKGIYVSVDERIGLILKEDIEKSEYLKRFKQEKLGTYSLKELKEKSKNYHVKFKDNHYLGGDIEGVVKFFRKLKEDKVELALLSRGEFPEKMLSVKGLKTGHIVIVAPVVVPE